MRHVSINIRHYGSTKQYKDCTSYKFGRDERQNRLLVEAGWRFVHRALYYAYFAPPDPSFRGKWATVEATIPDLDTIKALAMDLHTNGQAWRGELEGWPARYTPADRETRIERVTYMTPDGPISRQEVRHMDDPARFKVGESLLWNVHIRWDTGDDNPPHIQEEIG